MIPKVIHYCWFGKNPLPEDAKKCIESWKKYMPEYEIKEWNEDNYNIEMIPYTKEAYQAKKYAFVSDYARFWILYNFGGLYFDTDVEIIKPMNDIIDRGSFMGCENLITKDNKKLSVAPGLGIGCEKENFLYKEILDKYSKLHFLHSDGSLNLETVVTYTTNLLEKYGLKHNNEIQNIRNIWIYPKEFLCPKDYITGEITITPNTYAIHHYSASWKPWYVNKEKEFWNRLGLNNLNIILRIHNLFRYGTLRQVPRKKNK